MKPLHIGYICVEDPRDRRTWSGTNFHLLDALERAGHRVEVIAPLRPQPVLFVSQAFNFLSTRLLGKRFHYRDSHLLSRAYARHIERVIANLPLDLLLAPAGLATVAHLRTSVPVIHINDRCLHGALGYHRILRVLFTWSMDDALKLERRALHRADLTVYASDWAANAARKIAPERAHRILTLPFGANFVEAPLPPAPRRAPQQPWELLFMGVNWEDKGGAIALDALRRLRAKGFKARLTVVGCTAPAGTSDPDMQGVGFLNKNVSDQRERLERLFRDADALVLPTRFEAYGIVCCEAAAYGLPAFATCTGGIPTIVQDGVSGRLFEPADNGAAYADALVEVLGDEERWNAMRAAARARYEAVLNWDAFVRSLLRTANDHGLINSVR